jgi:Family of unknown function (DUF6252)
MMALASLAFFSCQKELSYEGGTRITPPPDSAASGADTMRATIDNNDWVAITVNSSVISGLSNTKEIEITGASQNGTPAISLQMPLDILQGGPYAFGITSATGIYLPTSTTVLLSTQGQLTILENNSTTRRLRGNFQFQAADPTGGSTAPDQLTKGYFSIQYTP